MNWYFWIQDWRSGSYSHGNPSHDGVLCSHQLGIHVLVVGYGFTIWRHIAFPSELSGTPTHVVPLMNDAPNVKKAYLKKSNMFERRPTQRTNAYCVEPGIPPM